MNSTARPILISPDQPVPPEFELLCESCGYSLVGLMTSRCPECGAPFDANELPLARIPWLYRKQLGKTGTYLRTAAMIVHRPRVFARELCRPVRISVSDAHAFRLLTIRIAATAVIVPIVVVSYAQISRVLPWWVWTAFWSISALGWVAVYTFLRMSTDLPTFIWRGLPDSREDLSPLHHYACAPLLLLPIPALIVMTGLLAVDHYAFNASDELSLEAWIAISLIVFPVMLLAWIIPLIIMKTGSNGHAWRVFAMSIYLPIHWSMIFMLVGLGAVTIALCIGGVFSLFR